MATVNWSLQHKRDTAANWTANNPTLLAGQLGIETDGLTTTPKFKIGDGSTAWNTLPYFYGGSASAQDLNNVLTVGNTTSGQDIVLTDDDKLQIGSTAGRYIGYDTNLIQIGLGIINTNSNDHIILQDGGGIHVDTTFVELPQLTASRVIATDANNRLSALTGTGFLTLNAGVISYDTNTYLTTAAAALAYQPLDSDLTSWAGVTRASGFDTFTATPSSANLRALLSDENGTGAALFDGATSPNFTTGITISSVAVPTISSTNTFTNKRITKRITTITSSATPTINTDNCDAVTITALAANITSFTTNLSGTPNDFDELIIRIKDNGTARTLAWGASFEAKGVALPTTTVISKVLTVKFIYDSVTSKWGCVASVSEY